MSLTAVPTVLLIEDNPAHAELIRRALENAETPLTLEHFDDAAAALVRLESHTSPPVMVVLLDLRMMPMDGFTVLSRIKSSEALKKTPVVILTSSDAETDIERAYAQHANSYLIKPLDFDDLCAQMAELAEYWLETNVSGVAY